MWLWSTDPVKGWRTVHLRKLLFSILSNRAWFHWHTHYVKSFAFCQDKILSNTKNINNLVIPTCCHSRFFFLAAYFISSLFFQLIISFKYGTLAPHGDCRSDMIGNLFQNIFLNRFFVLWPNLIQKDAQKTYKKRSDFQRNHWTIFRRTKDIHILSRVCWDMNLPYAT